MRLLKTFPAMALASSILVGGFGLPQTSHAQQISLSFGDSDRYDDSYNSYGESNVGGDLLGAFLTGVVNHFGRSEQDVYLLQDRGIRERELPVVFYLARQAGVSPMQIADMRSNGYSWSDITYSLGLNSDIYYVPVSGNYYGNYGSYYQMPRSRWSTLRLSDDAVIGLVNTRFISDYYHTPVDRVWRLNSSGRDYMHIARDYYRPERQGRLRVWNRYKGNSSMTDHTMRQTEVIQQQPMEQVNQREELRQQQIRMERQENNREAALRRDYRRMQEGQTQDQGMTERQERNREAALRRDGRQAEIQNQQMTERQQRNGEAVQRREARQAREQQAQENRQERRQGKAHRHNKKDQD